jgi:hypothetical protein
MSNRKPVWWSVRVELVSGGMAGELWPRPGRIFAVSTAHSLHDLAEAIDDGFARWDRSHLHEFELLDGRRATEHRHLDDVEPGIADADTVTVGEFLTPGQEFVYTFDLGDNWRHLCTVAGEPIDPEREVGIVPRLPCPYWGWGVIPDPYGRMWDGDDGETPVPPPPHTPWPWPDRPDPTHIVLHCPGQYTQLTAAGQTSTS